MVIYSTDIGASDPKRKNCVGIGIRLLISQSIVQSDCLNTERQEEINDFIYKVKMSVTCSPLNSEISCRATMLFGFFYVSYKTLLTYFYFQWNIIISGREFDNFIIALILHARRILVRISYLSCDVPVFAIV